MIEKGHSFSRFLADKFFQLFRKRTGITDRRSLSDTGSEGNGIDAALDQIARPHRHFLARAAAAVGKPIISISPSTSAKTPFFALMKAKSVVPGQ